MNSTYEGPKVKMKLCGGLKVEEIF